MNRETPIPASKEFLIKVEACGVWHGESVVKKGHFPGISYPGIPGQEVMGRIVMLGRNIERWSEGDRVGVGWHGGHCFRSRPCLQGNFLGCEKAVSTGIHRDGGYAEYMTAGEEALVHIPADLNAVSGAPLLCAAGRTSFGALKNSGAMAGDLVAIHGLGGLGHLSLQYAVRMGFKTVGLSRGNSKESLAYKLGARLFYDTTRRDAAKELAKLGGARAILCFAPNAKEISSLFPGLGHSGKTVIVTAFNEPMQIPANLFLGHGRNISGFAEADTAEALEFSIFSKVIAMVEVFPLEQAALAYEKMMKGSIPFRAVLTLNK